MTNTASTTATAANTNSIATAYRKIKESGINVDLVHGTDRQWAIVHNLPQMTEEETLQKLQVLASLDEGSEQWIGIRNEITEGNLCYAYSIASKYAFRFGTSLVDDVYQNASLALMKAIEDYLKNGNGKTWLNYAKATICNYVKRNCITPHLKCGIVGGLNPLNKKHNAETNKKRVLKGLNELTSVMVFGAESKDEEGNTVSKFDTILAEDASPLEALEEKEHYTAIEKVVAEALEKCEKATQKIWQLRKEGFAFEVISKSVGIRPKACQMRYYTARDAINNAVANYNHANA